MYYIYPPKPLQENESLSQMAGAESFEDGEKCWSHLTVTEYCGKLKAFHWVFD